MTVQRWGKTSSWMILIVVAIAVGAWGASKAAKPGAASLHGVVRSATGEPLAGIPVLANRPGTNITVAAYTDQEGRYGFPSLVAGSETVSIKVAGFKPVEKSSVNVTGKKATQVDFTLQAAAPVPKEMTDSEILSALPGTVEQKRQFFLSGSQECDQCHFLDRLIKNEGRDKAGWLAIIHLMRRTATIGPPVPSGKTVEELLARTEDINNRMADYLASALGPNASKPTFQFAQRPVSDASTHLSVIMYKTPRGVDPGGDIPVGDGPHSAFTAWTKENARWFFREGAGANRGDNTFSWLHDVLPDPAAGYVFYSDQNTSILGQVDLNTGEIREFQAPVVNPEKEPGSQEISLDKDGNVWLSLTWQGSIARFDPKAEKFTGVWPVGFKNASCGFNVVDSEGSPWCRSSGGNGSISRLDLATGQFTTYSVPKALSPSPGFYGIAIDSQNRIYACEFRGGGIDRFDPKTKEFKHWNPLTPDSGPRRPSIDSQDRLWFPEFFAGNLAMFDPETEKIKEWKVPGDLYAAPYVVAVDNKGHKVWVSDFAGDFIYVFDMRTEQFTQYLLPGHDIRIRDLMVDETTNPPSVWAPDFTPPGKVVKIQAW